MTLHGSCKLIYEKYLEAFKVQYIAVMMKQSMASQQDLACAGQPPVVPGRMNYVGQQPQAPQTQQPHLPQQLQQGMRPPLNLPPILKMAMKGVEQLRAAGVAEAQIKVVETRHPLLMEQVRKSALDYNMRGMQQQQQVQQQHKAQ